VLLSIAHNFPMDGSPARWQYSVLALVASCNWFFSVRAAAEGYTTNIIDGVTTNAAGAFTLGDTGPFNFLLITNGGRLTNTTGTIGNGSDAHDNMAVVVGADSIWESSSTLRVGAQGSSNSLFVLDGAKARSGYGLVGETLSSDGNSVLLVGPGSAWQASSGPNIGGAGSGTVSKSRRRLATGLRGGVGLKTTGSQLRLGDGSGSAWTNSGRFHVGGQGSFNEMFVNDGGLLNAAFSPVAIGDNRSARSNSVLVAGLGSRWKARELLVGYEGTFNQLTASGGARIESDRAVIGQNCTASDNGVLITGADTVWTNGLLEVGFCSTNNSLMISDGATVLAGLVRSSVQGGASNSFTVTGPGSLLRAGGDLVVGNGGVSNALLLSDGARVESRFDRVGFSGSRNEAIVTGSGTSWSNLSLIVGQTRGGNRLFFGNDARLDSGSVTIGEETAANLNFAELSGSGTVWNLTNVLTIGAFGSSNRLSIAGGGRINSLETILGAENNISPATTSAWNRIEVTGSNTVLNVTNALLVGGKVPTTAWRFATAHT
jgi:T5SS/PEP-CTERM-associated repeat protein